MSKSKGSEIAVGSSVVFTGFKGEDVPDNGEYLVVGEIYQVNSISPETEEEDASYILEVANPNYDSSKRSTKKNPNPPTLLVDCFDNEIELADEADEEGEEAEALEWSAVKKGDSIIIVENNEEGTEWYGDVTKKTKSTITIKGEDDDGNETETEFEKEEVYSMYAYAGEDEEQEEEEQEETPPPTKKKAASKKKATSKKKAAKKTDEEEQEEEEQETGDVSGLVILTEEEDDPEVLEMYNQSEDPISLLQELSQESSNLDYQIGGIIYHIRVDGAYKEIDPRYSENKGFEMFCEEMLNIGYRKAMYLSRVYSVWNKYGFDKALIDEHGWSKASAIAEKTTDENAKDIIKVLENPGTVEEVKATIKESFAKVGQKHEGGEIVRRKTFKFRIEEGEADAVENYLEMAAQEMDTEDLNRVFANIVTEYAQDHLDMDAVKKNLRKVKARNKEKSEETKKPVTKKTAAKKAPAKKTAAKRTSGSVTKKKAVATKKTATKKKSSRAR